MRSCCAIAIVSENFKLSGDEIFKLSVHESLKLRKA
jgi:hypothetical protein